MSKLPHSVPVNLGTLVEYAPHSVVSMEIVKTNSGTLTMFAFDAGQGLSEHSTPFDAVVQTLDGEAEWTIGGKQAIVRTGEAVLLPANVPHGVVARTPFKMLLIMIRG